MTRKQRLQAWVIAQQDDGSHTISHGGRRVLTGMTEREHALAWVKSHRAATERVSYEEPDGYRTSLTHQFIDPVEKGTAAALGVTLSPDDPHPVRTRYLARYGRSRRH